MAIIFSVYIYFLQLTPLNYLLLPDDEEDDLELLELLDLLGLELLDEDDPLLR
jgi:hypothetical protein